MKMQYTKALFIFRRDLRLEDNTGLLFALQNAQSVIPCFIFTPEQIHHNPYRSNRALQFMLESLEDLNRSLQAHKGRLYFFFGTPDQVVKQLIQEVGIDAVIANRDYTPYSIARDQKIHTTCAKHKISFQLFDDALLHSPEDTLKSDGTPYLVFTPFYRNALRLKVPKPIRNTFKNYYHEAIASAQDENDLHTLLPTREIQAPGGRQHALKILKNLRPFSHYATIRDFPSVHGTTHLSPHLKFTTCSVREIYHAITAELSSKSPLLRSLYWRDFFSSIAFHFPYVFTGAFHQKFDALKWSDSKKNFKKWCEGLTGFPIIDAGMRELNQTGYMHNRVRMIAGSFLVKDLHLNWRWGEQYFATTLIDYDPAINNGNWQWVASTGCDAQPYFRLFNPWTQQVKFDPDCTYIKQWVPEIAHLSNQAIHHWFLEKHHTEFQDYPAPMIDHAEEAKITLDLYKCCAKQA